MAFELQQQSAQQVQLAAARLSLCSQQLEKLLMG
jgi:hypothetical protein